jgi:DNA-binding HxlR family transcriptional regulator
VADPSIVDTAGVGAHHDYCPIAVANEVIGDRWTTLVLREIMVGSHRFNDIHRGIPRISRTSLSQRLRSLERDGLVERRPHDESQAVDYVLTAAGKDLEPIIWELGRWATRWVFGDPVDEQLDAVHLVWRLHQLTNEDFAPKERTTVEFQIRGPGAGRAWLVFDLGASTACQIDPGYEVDLVVRAENRELHRWLLGRTSWTAAIRAGDIELIGPSRLSRVFPRWFHPSHFVDDVRRGMTMSRVR